MHEARKDSPPGLCILVIFRQVGLSWLTSSFFFFAMTNKPTPLVIPPRNVLNTDDVDYVFSYKTEANKYPPHVANWVNTILKRWILRDSPFAKKVFDYREFNSAWFLVKEVFAATKGVDLRKLMAESTHLIDARTHEDWVRKALDDRQELVYIDREAVFDAFAEEFDHVTDFLCTLPEKPLSMTVDVVRRSVALWDRRIAREKLIGSLNDGVELIESPLFEKHTTPVVLVKLVAEQAYQNEGAVMKHCVGSYYGKKNTEIFSIRSTESEKPLATFEIQLTGKVRQLRQLRGPANRTVDASLTTLVHSWCTSQGISLKTLTKYDEEYEEEEREREDEVYLDMWRASDL